MQTNCEEKNMKKTGVLWLTQKLEGHGGRHRMAEMVRIHNRVNLKLSNLSVHSIYILYLYSIYMRTMRHGMRHRMAEEIFLKANCKTVVI